MAHLKDRRSADRVLMENPDVDRVIILKWIFEKWDGSWTGLTWLGIGTGGGLS